MAEKTTPKVSFSLSRAPSSPPNHSAAVISSISDPGDEAEDGTGIPQFITSFDASLNLIDSQDANPISIPPIPNAEMTIPNAEMKNVLPVPADKEDYKRWKFWEDMKGLPEDGGLEEFEHVKVEDFGIAYLAGYGWSPGQGIGRNKMLREPVIVEDTRRNGTAGLGYCKAEEET